MSRTTLSAPGEPPLMNDAGAAPADHSDAWDHPVWRRLLTPPLPPARVDTEELIDAPPSAVWGALEQTGSPSWRLPPMIQITPLGDDPPSWEVVVDAGPWRLPHLMRVAAARPPHELALVISGKLNAVVRFDLTPEPGEPVRSRLRLRLWFELTGSAMEAAVGGSIVQTLARTFAPAQLRALKTAAEGSL